MLTWEGTLIIRGVNQQILLPFAFYDSALMILVLRCVYVDNYVERTVRIKGSSRIR